MINWRKEIRFKKNDRIVFTTLLVLLFLCYLLPHMLSLTKEASTPYLGVDDILIKTDRALYSQKSERENIKSKMKSNFRRKQSYRKSKYPPIQYATFDPNATDSIQWLKLGVRPWTIKTIKNYLDKGGKFYNCEDLSKIFNLPDSTFRKLLPHCHIAIKRPAKKYKKRPSSQAYKARPDKPYKKKKPEMVDINTADATAIQSLYGLGPVLSDRLIRYRSRLGGFHSLRQITEVYGIEDSVYLENKDRILTSPHKRTIDINASIDSLYKHPYVDYNLARQITRYRDQHGLYQQIDELKQLITIADSTFEKLKPYLIVGSH